jgi:hypothetical protein
VAITRRGPGPVVRWRRSRCGPRYECRWPRSVIHNFNSDGIDSLARSRSRPTSRTTRRRAQRNRPTRIIATRNRPETRGVREPAIWGRCGARDVPIERRSQPLAEARLCATKSPVEGPTLRRKCCAGHAVRDCKYRVDGRHRSTDRKCRCRAGPPAFSAARY